MHSVSFHSSASDTGTATSMLVRRGQGSHRVCWEKDYNRADSLGKHHQAVENPEGKQLSTEGGKEKKKGNKPTKNHKSAIWYLFLPHMPQLF